jgi:hypothetical protein
MKPEEFTKLPLLLTRAQVLACGLPEKALLTCAVEYNGQPVPDGKIGVFRPNGKYALYRKVDVAKIIGFNL